VRFLAPDKAVEACAGTPHEPGVHVEACTRDARVILPNPCEWPGSDRYAEQRAMNSATGTDGRRATRAANWTAGRPVFGGRGSPARRARLAAGGYSMPARSRALAFSMALRAVQCGPRPALGADLHRQKPQA
jgi:hypothetical protein